MQMPRPVVVYFRVDSYLDIERKICSQPYVDSQDHAWKTLQAGVLEVILTVDLRLFSG